jgi:hypothetical protein
MAGKGAGRGNPAINPPFTKTMIPARDREYLGLFHLQLVFEAASTAVIVNHPGDPVKLARP